MFGPGGTFNILENRLELETIVVDTVADEPVDIWNEGNLTVRGTGVPHADTPTIAYRIDFGDTSIAFASDQNGSDPEFINFIQDVDFLVIHMTVNEDIAGMAADLHAKPSVWGQMASAAAVGHVVVSHIPNRAQLEQNLNVFSNNYTGEYTISDDLMCIELI
jgi:ribonuclease BN (tRNA processing enzyme)